MDLFWSRGYAGTSIDDLGATTGLGRGSIYQAFDDKHAIFMRALDTYCAAVLAAVRSQLRDAAGTALQRVINHVEEGVHTAVADSQRRGCLIANSASELGSADRDVVKRTNRTMESWRRELAAALAQARCDGELAPTTDTEALASMLLAVLRGAEALRKQGASAATVEAAGRQAVALLPRTRS